MFFHQQPKTVTMSLLLTNECSITGQTSPVALSPDEFGYGYICSEYEVDYHLPAEKRRILVSLWCKDENQVMKKTVFDSQESLFYQMQVFVKSPLADYSDIHRAKAFMGREFIQYYNENQHKTKNES